MEKSEATPETTEREREIIPLNDGFFLRVLTAARTLPDGDRGRVAVENAVVASEKAIFRYVGQSLADMGGDASSGDTGPLLPGGSSHDLESALSPATVAAGIVGKIEYPYKKPVRPNVNGKQLPEELETDAERAEWDRQVALFEEQRRVEVRAMKSLVFRFALGAVRVHQAALAESKDAAAELAAYGIPAGATEAFQKEVYDRFMSLPAGIEL